MTLSQLSTLYFLVHLANTIDPTKHAVNHPQNHGRLPKKNYTRTDKSIVLILTNWATPSSANNAGATYRACVVGKSILRRGWRYPSQQTGLTQYVAARQSCWQFWGRPVQEVFETIVTCDALGLMNGGLTGRAEDFTQSECCC